MASTGLPRRTRPLLIAPMIPLWGVVAFFGVEQLDRTRWLKPFVVLMFVLLAALFAHVAHNTLEARRRRNERRR